MVRDHEWRLRPKAPSQKSRQKKYIIQSQSLIPVDKSEINIIEKKGGEECRQAATIPGHSFKY